MPESLEINFSFNSILIFYFYLGQSNWVNMVCRCVQCVPLDEESWLTQNNDSSVLLENDAAEIFDDF